MVFDFLVGVTKLLARHLGQMPPNSGLTGPHRTYQVNILRDIHAGKICQLRWEKASPGQTVNTPGR